MSSAPPVLSRPKVPLTTPESVSPLITFKSELAASVTLPPTVNAPVLMLSPKATVPERTIAFAIERIEVESLEMRPAVANKVPVPSAMLLPICNAPSPSLKPPVKELKPESVSAPDPAFTSALEPLITPV